MHLFLSSPSIFMCTSLLKRIRLCIMRRYKAIYVEQFGAWWSLTPDAWSTCVYQILNGLFCDLDEVGKRLSTRPTSCWSVHRIKHPVDWTMEDWNTERQALIEEGLWEEELT